MTRASRHFFYRGDGDYCWGVRNPAALHTDSMYYYIFLFSYYEKHQGVYVAVNLPFTNNSRKRPLGSDENMPLKGDIQGSYTSTIFPPDDTIRFRAFIVDRALTHSDTILTPDIIIGSHDCHEYDSPNRMKY